jgi:pyruvate,water dikinase
LRPVPLAEVDDPGRFGAKASQLGASLRAGLPVPPGWALSHALVEAVARAEPEAVAEVRSLGAQADGALAVRSSGVGEDGVNESFAGQHASLLNVAGVDALLAAVLAVHASGDTASARAYRRRMGVAGAPRVGVVVQRLVDATCAGVMFTVDPLSGADVRVVEASWGLGEAVVQGLVTPDRLRFTRDGRVLEHAAGHKDLAMVRDAGGGVREVEVEAHRVAARCLDGAMVDALAALATRCEQVFGEGRDVEWAFAGGALHLLQVRAVTRRGGG